MHGLCCLTRASSLVAVRRGALLTQVLESSRSCSLSQGVGLSNGGRGTQRHAHRLVVFAAKGSKSTPESRFRKTNSKQGDDDVWEKPQAFEGFMPGAKGPVIIPKKEKGKKGVVRREKAPELQGPRTGKMRLSVALSSAGVASRRKSEDIIRTGTVTVNGTVADLPQTMVDPMKDKIAVNNKPIRNLTHVKDLHYLAVYKPKGYVCSSARQSGEQGKIVEDLLTNWRIEWQRKATRTQQASQSQLLPPRMVSVGRLDSATTGLLLLTNDGRWAQQVAHPSNGITKEYVVTANAPVSRKQVRQVLEGCEVEGKKVVPVSCELMLDANSSNASRSRVKVVVNEGRHHEVRELMKHAEVEVKALKRTRVGGLRIAGMSIGQVLELKPHEVRRVLDKGLMNNPSAE